MVLKHYFRLRILLHDVWVVKRCTILHIHLSRSQLREWRAMCERALKENKRIEENFRSTHILHSSIHLAEYYSNRLHLSVSRCSHMKMLIRIWIELNNGFVISSTYIHICLSLNNRVRKLFILNYLQALLHNAQNLKTKWFKIMKVLCEYFQVLFSNLSGAKPHYTHSVVRTK